jgi:hypothetical protein
MAGMVVGGRMAHGENHYRANLSDEQIKEIRELFRAHKWWNRSISQTALGQRFGVSVQYIHAVVSGKVRRGGNLND